MNDNPWNRLTPEKDGVNETGKAFHAFMLYRDMNPKDRSIEKIPVLLGKKPGYKRPLYRWSSLFHWVDRARAYDQYIASQKAEKQKQAIIDMADRQARQGMALQVVGMKKFFDDNGNLKPDVIKDMNYNDAIRAFIEGAKIERMARGEPTEIQELTLRPGKPFEEYTNEELDWTLETGKPIEERKQLE